MAARFMICRVTNSQDGVEDIFAGTGGRWNGSCVGMGGHGIEILWGWARMEVKVDGSDGNEM